MNTCSTSEERGQKFYYVCTTTVRTYVLLAFLLLLCMAAASASASAAAVCTMLLALLMLCSWMTCCRRRRLYVHTYMRDYCFPYTTYKKVRCTRTTTYHDDGKMKYIWVQSCEHDIIVCRGSPALPPWQQQRRPERCQCQKPRQRPCPRPTCALLLCDVRSLVQGLLCPLHPQQQQQTASSSGSSSCNLTHQFSVGRAVHRTAGPPTVVMLVSTAAQQHSSSCTPIRQLYGT